jgi:hypothetical protein
MRVGRTRVGATLVGVLFGAMCVGPTLGAQPYVEGGQTRHRFAQTTLGTDARVFAPGDPITSGSLQDARLIIGGTHFWGHADLFVAVPIGWSGETGFRSRVETGGRYYPWRVERNRIRPYVGASILGTTYQETGGASQTRFHVPLTAGLTYQAGNTLVSLNAGWMRHESTYYSTSTVPARIRMHPGWVGLGLARTFDTTLGAERGWQDGETEIKTLRGLASGALDAWTISVGPSSAFFTKTSGALRDRAYAGQHEVTQIFPEFGVGRYFAERDMQFNLAYRTNTSEVAGHGYEQTATRRAITAELFWFLFDWHGFVPFLGGNLGHEMLTVRGYARGSNEMTSYGLTGGWDIRPDRLQAFTLRTTLRYSPRLVAPTTEGRPLHFDQLEVNFIQLVIYPGRIWR